MRRFKKWHLWAILAGVFFVVLIYTAQPEKIIQALIASGLFLAAVVAATIAHEDGETEPVFAICEKCGAALPPDEAERHEDWHERLRRAVDGMKALTDG